MKNFFRFAPSPDVVGLFAYYPDSPMPETDEYRYVMPARRNDIFRIIIDNPEGTTPASLAIALVEETDMGIEIVIANIAVFVFSETSDQLFAELSIPNNIAQGCYRLLLYAPNGTTTYGPWVETARECEDLGDGFNVTITEERDVNTNGTPTAFRISNELAIGTFEDSVLLSYRNRTNGFGYDYSANPDFVQQVRLEMYLSRPQHTLARSAYRQTNDVWRSGNVRIGKKYALNTEYLDEITHDALFSALNHSAVSVAGKFVYLTEEGEDEFVDSLLTGSRTHPLWYKTYAVTEQGYNEQNTGCGNAGSDPDELDNYNEGVFEGVFE